MISEESKATAEKARKIYESQLRQQLEQDYPDRYVCIEPLSGMHFIGKTFDEAVNAAIDAFPDRLTHTLRIGHSAALHLGCPGLVKNENRAHLAGIQESMHFQKELSP
jgi:hypothetical protein